MDTAFLLLLLLCAIGAPALAGAAVLSAWSWPRRMAWFFSWVLVGWAITVVCVGYWLAMDGLNSVLDPQATSARQAGAFDILTFTMIHSGPWNTLARYAGWLVPMVAFGFGAGIAALVSARQKAAQA
jgi:hypothetical protein